MMGELLHPLHRVQFFPIDLAEAGAREVGRNSTTLGALFGASDSLQKCFSASALQSAPRFKTTNAWTASPDSVLLKLTNATSGDAGR
jgi:hypothetical protein